MGEKTFGEIPLSEIRPNPVALREVDRQSEKYLGLVDSIKAKGILNSVSVKNSTDDDGNAVYALIDGLHRYTAALDAGLSVIPAQVLSMDDAETLEAQVMANIHKIETKPVQYSHQLMRIMAYNPTMTISDLAVKLTMSQGWVSERLGLLKLDEKIAELVDNGEINLSNAYALAKLPKEEQGNYVQQAMSDSPQEFVASCNTRAKEIRDAKRQGRDAGPSEFVPVAHLQKLGDIKDEATNAQVRDTVLKQLKAKSAADGWNACLQWVQHLDPSSIEAAKAKAEARKAELDEAKNKRKVERTERAQKDQEARSAEAAADVAAAKEGKALPSEVRKAEEKAEREAKKKAKDEADEAEKTAAAAAE